MTRFKFGKRVCAFALSALLVVNCAVPAFASSGQLVTVGWAETVSAFLMACGVYPYNDDEESQFSEWSVDSLTALYNQFVDEVDSGVANVEQAVIDFLDAGKSIARLTSSLVRGVISIASGRWSVLRAFATWIVDKYSVTDNQTGVKLGVISSSFPSVPVSSSVPSAQFIKDSGLYFGRQSDIAYVGVSSVQDSCCFYFLRPDGRYALILLAPYVDDVANISWWYIQYYNSTGNILTSSISAYMTLNSYSSGRVFNSSDTTIIVSSLNSSIPIYDSIEQAVSDFLLGGSAGFSGVTADTTTVSVPDALPDDSEFGGLVVQGAGEGVTPEQLQDLIREAVRDALKPSVNVVPVVVAPDVDVSASGDIKTDLEIGGQDVPMTASDYSAPNITGVFPFSIPWDLMAIYGALNASPVRPDFEVSIYVPLLNVNVPFRIGVTDETAEAVDNAMSVWRDMLLVAMCVGTLFVIWKLKS